ncbi:rCG32848 [Rattus norvegicus]|uniref:RCG32848 n=1 Tax=Rattus norvegicus TaxID=10116 RepID=A6HFI2_RAT|nr:rCG32848 [Rattus norvegicus]
MLAISFSVSALFKRGLILKYSFIQGQCFTFMKARTLYWMQKMDSL